MPEGSVETKAEILVVDDDPDISQALLDFLQHDGYRVDVASTGFEALARSKQLPYSAVILDLGLPDVDGLVKDLADGLAEWDAADALGDRLDAISARMACHGSVRSGRVLRIDWICARLSI